MYAKKVRRKCGVRGCRNTDSYSISYTREAGNTVIICPQCLKQALELVGNQTGNTAKQASRKTEIKPLFYHPEKVSSAPREVEKDKAQRSGENDSISSLNKEEKEISEPAVKQRTSTKRNEKAQTKEKKPAGERSDLM